MKRPCIQGLFSQFSFVLEYAKYANTEISFDKLVDIFYKDSFVQYIERFIIIFLLIADINNHFILLAKIGI